MQISRMVETDVSEAAKLETRVFSTPWSEESFLQAVQNKDAYYVVAKEEGRIVGQCGYYDLCGMGEILNVAVDPEKRRSGIARAMLLHLFQYGKEHGISEFTLEVRANNEPAISLYKSLGFEPQGIRPNFYENPKEDALIMNKVGELC